MTDEQIVEGCKLQNPSHQRKLYEKFSRKMFGVCLRYASNREEAEDLLQDSFVKVFQHISSFKMEGSLEGWVRRIVVNTSLEFIRKQKLQWVSIDSADEPAESEVVLDHMNAKELLMIINKLPSGFKAVFNLYAIEGYNHREIGELLGITESTSKSQYSRAKSALVKSIKEIESTTKDIVKE